MTWQSVRLDDKKQGIVQAWDAVTGLGIDDLEIGLDGPEPPVMDGSFQPWFEALQGAEHEARAAGKGYVQLAIGESGE